MAKTITATVNKRIPVSEGTGAFYFGSFVPDSEYETAGDTVTNPAAPALRLPERIEFILISGSSAGGYRAAMDAATGKIKIFTGEASGSGKGSKEVAAKADLSAETFPFMAYGP